MPSPAPQAERRKKPRVPVDFAVVVHMPDEDPMSALAKDVSEVGIAVRCAAKLPLLTKVELELDLPKAETKDPVRGRVVRCTPVSKTTRVHDLGIEFTSLPSVVRAAILASIKKAAAR